MISILKKPRVLLGLVAIATALAAFLVLIRSSNRAKQDSETQPKPNLAYLSVLNSNQLLAKVGAAELRGQDLKDALQLEFHGQMLHSSLSPQDLSIKIAAAVDKLIEDELLAQEAKRKGLKTLLQGALGRQDLASQYLQVEMAKLPLVSDQEMRLFYKNHEEKFVIPAGVQVRELYLPHQGDKDSKEKREKAYLLGEELAARIKKGESLEELGKDRVPGAYLERTKGYLFKGAVMDAADEQKVLALRPSEVIGPLRVEGGYSVFQGIVQVRARLIPFYQAQEKIKVYLESRRDEELRKNLVHQLQRQTSVQRFGPDTVLAAVR